MDTLTPYLRAVRSIFDRIAETIPDGRPPVAVYIAGGCAVHWYSRERVTGDVDAEFSQVRAALQEIVVNYVDEQGKPRSVYLDRNFHPALTLMHEDYQQDAVPIGDALGGAGKLVVHVLAPVDLAISKLARFAEHDREDIATLGRLGLIDVAKFRERAEVALHTAIGVDPANIRLNIRDAVALVESGR